MTEASPVKIRQHAPYRKSFLIPLWVVQLSFSVIIFIFSCINIGTSNVPSYRDHTTWLTLDIIHFLLNLVLSSSVIFVIIKFSSYTLSTELFKIQSIIAVVLSGICTVIYLGMLYWFSAIFSGMAWVASIAICSRVCVLRKRVQRGEAAEMRRRTKEVDCEVGGEVELEDSNKFRGVEFEIAGVSRTDGRMVLQTGERLEVAKPTPSINSAATSTSGAPPKYVREIV